MYQRLLKVPYADEWSNVMKELDNLRATVGGIAKMSANEGRRMKMWAEDAVKGFDTKIGETLLAQANEILQLNKVIEVWEYNYKSLLKSQHSVITTAEKNQLLEEIAALRALHQNQYLQRRNQEAAFNTWQQHMANATKEYNATVTRNKQDQ